MAEDFEITGKNKLVVDESGYFNTKRSPSDQSKLSPELGTEFYSGVYFNSADSVDKVRIVSGKHWDFRHTEGAVNPHFGQPGRFKSFANDYISLETCSDVREAADGLVLEQEILLKGKYAIGDPQQSDNDTATELQSAAYKWGAYVKAGYFAAPGDFKSPIIKANHTFYDHYHSTFVPYTPDELITKQPAGKAYFADYKTYYNERLDSAEFEKVTGLHKVQNALPNIYGFIRLVKNELLLEDGNFELTKLINYIKSYRWTNKPQTRKDVYNRLFQKYPLETLTFLYALVNNHRTDQLTGKMYWLDEDDAYNNQMIERIINLDYTKFDASALFEEYFDTYTNLMTGRVETLYGDDPGAHGGVLNKIKALERIMSRIVFSPEFIPIMKKVDQYKKYFPYYVDLQFTAKRLTSIGDLMKKLFMTRYLSYKMVAFKNDALDFDPDTKDWAQYIYGITDSWCPGATCDKTKKFIEFSSETRYHDLFPSESEVYASLYGRLLYTFSEPAGKRTLDLMPVLEAFSSPNKIDSSGATVPAIDPHVDATEYEPGSNFYRDVRNYVTFVRDDFKNPVNLTNDDNTIFRMLCGTAFRFKILDMYKNKRRSYMEILNGKPAYSEDLFYRIEKWSKKNESGAEWKIIQHIIIPNTSELDIARYVDTQLKYSTYATYKYNVYTMRVVFGSKYKYFWGKSASTSGGQTFLVNTTQTFLKAAFNQLVFVDQPGFTAPDLPFVPNAPPNEQWDGLTTPDITQTTECQQVSQTKDQDYWKIQHYYATGLDDDGLCDCSDDSAVFDPADADGHYLSPFATTAPYSPLYIGQPWVDPVSKGGPGRECTSEQMAQTKINQITDTIEKLAQEKGNDYPMGLEYAKIHKMTRQVPAPSIQQCDPPVLHLPSPVGGKYEYSAKFLVRLEPSIQVIEDKLFSTPEILIMDRPPMPPDVNIIPYRAVNNKLKFLINGTTGRAKEKPVIILDSDNEKFDWVKRGQLVTSPIDSSPLEGQEIEFANDDPVRKFQIFRIRTKPVTYGDFELYQQINGGIFEEEILPNTKYYYTFRSIDLHDHISNPSPVYEVELIDEHGAVKPMIRLISIEPTEPKTFTKECQKYIYLKPSLRQLDFSEHEDVDSIFSSEDKKKKYKLRLTSKGSGKKLDINFSFAKIPDPDQ